METRNKRRRIEMDLTTMLGSSLKIMVENQWLDAWELEALALTSKEFYVAATNDDTWRSLCKNDCPEITRVDPSVTERTCFRWLYWQMMAKPQRNMQKGSDSSSYPSDDKTVETPASCTVKDFVLLGHLYRNEEVVASFNIEGSELEAWMNAGAKHILDFREPWKLGKAAITSFTARNVYGEQGLGVWVRELTGNTDIRLKVHILRKTDLVVCCLYDDELYDYDPLLYPMTLEERKAVDLDEPFNVDLRDCTQGIVEFKVGHDFSKKPPELTEDGGVTRELHFEPSLMVGGMITGGDVLIADRVLLTPSSLSQGGVDLLQFFSGLEQTNEVASVMGHFHV